MVASITVVGQLVVGHREEGHIQDVIRGQIKVQAVSFPSLHL